ncbi:hypothetical protein SODALDRAFT_341175 [Sodiomyces alkalinus F11]|uniref:mRNA N(6)-methyladenine demethylase n=1 Tax=Sodiomyces alkalinus (strain CBS 110278 / VKM F-3762 / F11) TaxID=1314773 RepID=A0A3N2PNZ6_SODAK|nr:hypothetical protein SODALDRAFT_341175 [Sodiomyces alkalinus F11]ROT36219.1 hypothetical protein SODALDRAFT_341175 [Sodiomyces alkalinus F11]
MATDITQYDAHEQPSDELRTTWKSYSKTEHKNLLNHPDIDDPRSESQRKEYRVAGTMTAEQMTDAFTHIHKGSLDLSSVQDTPILYHPLIPGLLIVPNLVPPPVQKSLLSLLVHRDLSIPHHQTNMHLHYELPYRQLTQQAAEGSDQQGLSFFSYPPDSAPIFTPKDPSVHKPLSMKQVLDRRLHWVTLGGQYDWTNRVYPGQEPRAFPSDLARFLETLFPETRAEAAIVNFYNPGDTMMMHRDVSEESSNGLISVSLGCDGLFMIAPNETIDASASEDKEAQKDGRHEDATKQKPYLLLRLRSGDAIYMTQDARFAWHGVPKVLKGTCPDFLRDWPAEEDGRYEAWKGWMANKRVNLNVRQMKD